MSSCLSKLKVTPSFCFAFKIPDNVTASTLYMIQAVVHALYDKWFQNSDLFDFDIIIFALLTRLSLWGTIKKSKLWKPQMGGMNLIGRDCTKTKCPKQWGLQKDKTNQLQLKNDARSLKILFQRLYNIILTRLFTGSHLV